MSPCSQETHITPSGFERKGRKTKGNPPSTSQRQALQPVCASRVPSRKSVLPCCADQQCSLGNCHVGPSLDLTRRAPSPVCSSPRPLRGACHPRSACPPPSLPHCPSLTSLSSPLPLPLLGGPRPTGCPPRLSQRQPCGAIPSTWPRTPHPVSPALRHPWARG